MINAVHHIDCLIGMRSIPDKSIDMILCDLPYGTTACKWDVIIPFEPLWKQYERIIKDKGAIVLFGMQPFTSLLITSNIKLFKYELIYQKHRSSGFLNAPKMPLRSHENIMVFGRGCINYYPIKTPAEKIDNRKTVRDQIVFSGSTYNGSKQYINIRKPDDGFRYPLSVVKINNPFTEQGLHPTQKPVPLFEYLIKTYTNEGETVLDNCAGSGTTAIACINTNRNYILMEKEEKYYNMILNRIKRHTPQLKLIA